MNSRDNTGHRHIVRSRLSSQLAEYICAAPSLALPEEVVEKSTLHVLDAIASIVSGATLDPGRLGARFAVHESGPGRATVVGQRVSIDPAAAAFANGMAAHADETDDSHGFSFTHPGCAVVPAALAMAETMRSSGMELLRAVALGYDIGTRSALALGEARRDLSSSVASTHCIGACFGAGAAAGALSALEPIRARYLLAYVAHQAGGVQSFLRDTSHIGKAFVFGGMPARAGVLAARMVQSGFCAEEDILDGEPNFFSTVSATPDPQAVVSELGQRWEILRTNIKRYSVGSPLQAVVEALVHLVKEAPIESRQLAEILVLLPPREAFVGAHRSMPDIDISLVAALVLLDGNLTFAAVHDARRMGERAVMELRDKVRIEADPQMRSGSRQATVELSFVDGLKRSCHVEKVRGTAQNPMGREEIEAKALELIGPVAGERLACAVVRAVRDLPNCRDIEVLRDLMLEIDTRHVGAQARPHNLVSGSNRYVV